jgi:hypothetical protein
MECIGALDVALKTAVNHINGREQTSLTERPKASNLVKENDLLFAASKRGEFKMLPQTVQIKGGVGEKGGHG